METLYLFLQKYLEQVLILLVLSKSSCGAGILFDIFFLREQNSSYLNQVTDITSAKDRMESKFKQQQIEKEKLKFNNQDLHDRLKSLMHNQQANREKIEQEHLEREESLISQVNE